MDKKETGIIDLVEIVTNKLNDFVGSGEAQELIEKHVTDTAKKAIKDLFGYGFERDIKDLMEKDLGPLLKKVSFTEYRSIMLNQIKGILDGIVGEDLIEQVTKVFQEVLTPETEPLKLSEFFEDLREHYIEDMGHEEGYDEYSKLTISQDRDSSASFRWYTINFGKEDEDENTLRIHNYKDEPFTISSLYTSGMSFDRNSMALMKITSLYKFEQILISAFLSERKIELDIDEDDVDTSLWEEH